MADDEESLNSSTFTQPRIVYIRLGKDKTKDDIQDEIFKEVRKAFKGSEASENGGKLDKNVVVLPGFDARVIQDVAIGGDYVGLLLKDGRVCRFKCLCRNIKPCAKRKASPSAEEQIFQVQSDEAYARRLQDQINTRNLGSSSALGSSGTSNISEETMFGLTEPAFRFGMPTSDSNLLESANVPTEISANGAESLTNLPESNFGNLTSVVPGRTGSSEKNGTPNEVENSGEKFLDSTQVSSNPEKGSSSSSSTKIDEATNQSSEKSPNNTSSTKMGSKREDESVRLSSRSTPDLHSTLARTSTVDVRQSSSLTNISTTRENVQSTPSFIPRRPPPSPTVVHRTILTADPILLRTSRPVFIPSHVIIPSFPQASTSVYTFDPRRLSSTFTSRTPVRVLQRSGRRQIASPYEYRRSRDNSVLRRDRGNGAVEQSTEEAASDFHYPDIDEIEWLQTENGEPVQFSDIGALHSEFILVEKHNGLLYHWPYSADHPCSVAMETDSLESELPDVGIPRAKVSPLIQELKLEEEQVIKLATHGIRCSLVTKSGKICTFYDKFMRECNNGQVPALIQQLSHPAVHFPELRGDSITSVHCSEFFSSVMTQKGKIYWWGLLPSKERQDFKQKLNKESSNNCSIAVNNKVQLRKHLPGFPGALVFKSSETYGPQLGRLLSHETEEGTNQSAVKIKVERVPKLVKSQPNSGSNSPIVNLQSRMESPLPKGAASPLQLIAQEARSSSPHTSIRNQSHPDTPIKSNPNVETWDVNDVVFLESESKVLGTVAAIDGPHVIVKVDNVNISSDSSLRVFKVSELETVLEDAEIEIQGASTSSSISSSTMYRGCIQSTPKCILDASRTTVTSDKEVLSGLNPVAMTTTSTGISVLVNHKESNKAFFIGPAIDSGNNDKVFTCCSDLSFSRGNDDACVTVESESVYSHEAALTTKPVKTESIGQKRKHPAAEEPDDYDGTCVSSNQHPVNNGRPTLHTSQGTGVILLCDKNGCLYPRPFGTKLSDPCAIDLPPLHCLGLGQKLGYTSKCEAEERILMVFLAFKEQKLLPAIQSGIVTKVQEVLDVLERSCMMTTHKGKSSISGAKKLAQEAVGGKAWSPKQAAKEDSDEASKIPVFTPEVMSIVNEHTSSNQNAMHVCCTNPAYLTTEAQEKEPLEVLLADLSKGSSKSTPPSKHVEVAVLDKLLNHRLLATKFISMLKDQDAKGCTPFMLSIQCHNFKAALYILDFVAKYKGKQFGDCVISLETMIFPPTFSGITPLHALALACTENLPASGLGNSLTVSNLPSGYTPRILLKLFQSRYPSAYRATIPPLAEAKKYPRAKTPRQRLLEKGKKQNINTKKVESTKKVTLDPTSTPGTTTRLGPGSFGEAGRNRIPVVNNRRESLQGMVTFSDPRELRQALIEMDKHMVSSETMVPEGGLASLVQHVLHVKLTELGNDDDDKMEMEVGIRGGVYNVSTSSGTAKISRKTQTIDPTNNQQGSLEDDLICRLFSRLLSYQEMATAANQQEETVLSFFVNNSRWIKLTAHQKQRLLKYSTKLIGSQTDDSTKPPRSSTPDLGKTPDDITAEINIKGASGTTATIESNLLAQLDEISSSFKSLVDTLAALEGKVADEMNAENEKTKEGPDNNGAPSTSRNLIDFNAPSPEASVPEKDEALPILIQLAQNWPCVATTILGYFPELTQESPMEGSDGDSHEGLRGQDGTRKSGPSKSCNIDGFVVELLANTEKSVLITLVETIVKEMNKYPQDLLLEVTKQCQDTGGPYTPGRLAITVGMKFVRAVVRQMSVHLSRSGVSYVDLRSRLASSSSSSSPSTSSVTFGSDQNSNVEFKQKARMILKSFSWFGIYELVQAAEATVLPVREGVAKAQAKTTGASISNNVPTHTVFPGGRYGGRRPGIRVSQYDSRSTNQEAMLRTASRLPGSNQTTPVQQCHGTRLAALADDTSSPPRRQTSSPPLSLRGYSRATRRRGSTIDSDSDTDEETGTLFRSVMDEDNDMDIDDGDSSSVAMATGLNVDHPYAWALDGRLFGTGESNSQNNLQINFTHYINNIVTPPSVHTGNCYLTRMYSRLVKEAIDVITSGHSEENPASKDTIVSEEPVLQVLAINPDECGNILEQVTSLLDVTWVWLAKVLDVVEGQLQHGEGFDTKRYLATLQRPEESEFTPLPRSTSTTRPGSTPEEYLMFLLRSHTNEHNDTLPVIDMLCYEHIVYILDSFIYCMKLWPKSRQILDRNTSSISSIDGEESSSGISSADTTPANNDSGLQGNQANPRRRRSKEREDCIKFYGMNVTGKERDEFLNNIQATLQQKSRMLVPKATWEVFTHNVGTLRMKSVEEASHAGRTGSDVENALPVTFDRVSRQPYPSPLVHNWSVDQVIERWKISVDLFSRLFLADGPGAERDSFLAARAGVAGRLARFRRTIVYLRESVTADSQQSGLAFGGLGGRVGTTLSIAVKRIRLLEDTLRILGEMQPFHYSNFRAKFEGEEGSGPGVNRGFFAAVANALKSDDKLPPETTSLLHEPGKLPEQSGFYAPKPFALRESTIRNHEQLKTRRLKMFTAIGRFLGLSLWFNNTVPLNFSRHVIKFLLDRDVTWEDLIFFNADLFEGLSRMMIDAAHPMMTSERFQATYCCHFETSVGGTTEELLPDGSQIPVTPTNIFKYVRLYATKVMVGCIEEELRCMRNGLHDVIPSELLVTLSPEDFQLLLSGGTTDIDISKLRALITFTNSNGCSKDILERFKRWFWSIVQKMTPLQRQQLLYFCTGSAVLPVMNDRRDPDQDLSITVDVISGNTKALPMATTCGQRMSIPLYPSKKILKKKLLQAIQCQSYGLG